MMDTGDIYRILDFTVETQPSTFNNSCPVGELWEYPAIPDPNITENFTFPNIWIPEPYPAWEVTLKVVAYVIAMLIAIIGNLIVILTVWLNKNMHRTTFYYITNLAVSDMIVGLLQMWIHLGMGITHEFPFSSMLCKIFPFFQILALTASTLFLTAIAVDRFFCIVFPLKAFDASAHSWIHILTMVGIWVVAILVAVPMIKVRALIVYQYSNYRQAWCDERWPRYFTEPTPEDRACPFDMPQRRIYYTLSVVLMYIIPMIVMIAAYSIISYTLHTRKLPGEQIDQTVISQQRTKRKVVRMLIAVLVAFFLCWTIQELIVLFNALDPDGATNDLGDGLKYGAIYVAYFNSALNPILYAGFNSKFRQGFRNIGRCTMLRRNRTITPTKELSPD